MDEVSRPVRILSLDGGGMRGLFPAKLLSRLEQLTTERLAALGRKPEPLAKLFDVFAGTSTGAIIAVGLAGIRREGEPLATPDELVRFYCENARHVFAGRRYGILRTKYEQSALAGIFSEICGDARLSEVQTNILIPAFDIENRSGFLFRGGPGWMPHSQADYYLRDALLAATATPFLFPPAYIAAIGQPELRAFIDGGSFANNPSFHAYLDGRQLFGDQRQILLLSLGTGDDFKPIDYHIARRWGLGAWFNPRNRLPLVRMLMYGQSDQAHQNLRRLIPDTRYYIRLDAPQTSYLPSMDDASPAAVRALSTAADEFVAESEDILRDIARRLVIA
jgi:uncharacterized protein